ncbi:CCA tRNA nucleotidyltransferase [bacterium]|nr:CCA tRNA nucleotidyltransferase [bacterium]
MQNEAHNLAESLEAALPVALRHIPHRIRDVARELDMSAALSGGIARDLIRIQHGQLYPDQLASELRDFDIMVAGPSRGGKGAGVIFAYELARRLPGQLTINEAFHTATLITSDPLRIDITTARRESYSGPGQLPEVDLLDIDLATDLARRDFTCNALAIDLSDNYGLLLDPHGGIGDIVDGLVRVLHPASFSDDPTRLMRAIRYSVRLNYDLEPTTRAMYQAAIDNMVLDHISAERIRYELECIGREDRWIEILAALDVSGLLHSISSGLGGVSGYWELENAQALDIAINNQPELMQQAQFSRWFVRLAWVLLCVPPERLAAVSERVGLDKRPREWLLQAQRIIRLEVRQLDEDLPPSKVCERLEKYARQAIALAMFVLQPASQHQVGARRQLKRWLEEYSLVRSELDGHELLALGLRPGPLVGQIRDTLRYLRLDGIITSVEEERQQAAELITEHATAGNGQPVETDEPEDGDDSDDGDEEPAPETADEPDDSGDEE